jgi:alpha-amylase
MADLNGTMMQYFHHYRFKDGADWDSIGQQARELSAAGITALWLPPLFKSRNLPGLRDVLGAASSDLEATSNLNPEIPKPCLTAIDQLQTANIQTYVSISLPPDGVGPDLLPKIANWEQQSLQVMGVNGICFERVQQIQPDVLQPWLHRIQQTVQSPLFLAGEYWTEQVEVLHQYIQATAGQLSLFDVPLHYNFYRASRSGGYYDMSKLLKGSLMLQQPALAVTFVENHHSQPLQPLESVVEPWFKPLAYAVILLRREGYPCLFYADYYGAHYQDQGRDGRSHEIWMDCHRWLLDRFLYARRHYAYGKQYDYFDHDSVVGWTRLGNTAHPKTMAVLMSDGWGGSKWMDVGRPNAAFYDLTEHIRESVYTNEHGWGEFHCRGGSVSVWLEE